MSMYKASGEENLRANPSVKTGSTKASPSGGGKDAGGTSNLRANQTTKRAGWKETPGQQSIDVPPGVQTFDDDMGRPN